MMGLLSQEACDPKTLASCQRVWPAAGEWGGEMGTGWGKGEGNHCGGLRLRLKEVESWAGRGL